MENAPNVNVAHTQLTVCNVRNVLWANIKKIWVLKNALIVLQTLPRKPGPNQVIFVSVLKVTRGQMEGIAPSVPKESTKMSTGMISVNHAKLARLAGKLVPIPNLGASNASVILGVIPVQLNVITAQTTLS